MQHWLSRKLLCLFTLCIPVWTSANEQCVVPRMTLSSTIVSDNPYVYQSGPRGQLKKLAVIQNSNGITIAKEPIWDAGQILTGVTGETPSGRTIATTNSVIRQTVRFELNNLPAEIKTVFNTSPDTKALDGLGTKRVSYLFGERIMEDKKSQPQFRPRENVLGDIVNSAPVYVGAPDRRNIGAKFQSFYEQNKSRTAALYVGANDCMLHAFSANSGRELFAYIPSPLLKRCPKITDKNSKPEPTMDGNIHVTDAIVNGTWKTVLAAGMGMGAKGVFALDVTSPEHFMEGRRALFEFTDKDDPDIGYVTDAPFITKIGVGNNVGNERYFVVVTNGDNALFLLSLDKDQSSPWIANHNYYKVSTTSSGLSMPGFALDRNGAALYGYAGDLIGNVWRFDFTGGNPTSTPPQLIFSAKDNHNNPQAITTQPVVAFAPDGGYLVLFGTGDGNESRKQNSFYAIRDTTKRNKEDYFIAGRAQLAKREIVQQAMNGDDFFYGNAKLANTGKKGWYFDYSNGQTTGERSVSAPVIDHGNVFFNTIIPTNSACSTTSVSYRVNVLTGKAVDAKSAAKLPSQSALFGPPILFYAKPTLGQRDSFGRRTSITTYFIANFGPLSEATSSETLLPSSSSHKTGRLSWREIPNWRDK